MATRPIVYAHRGGSALRPENTLAAFDHGIALGADGLELDVHLSRDGTVVVVHDATLDRTTDRTGAVSALSAVELAAVDAGYRFRGPAGDYPYRGCGCGVTTLRAVLERYRDTRLIVELKTSAPELARLTVDEIRRADAVDRSAIGSFSRRALRAVRALEPRIPTGSSREETRWALYRSWIGWPLGTTRYRELQVPERSGSTTIVTPRFIAHAHRAGLPVKVWTVDDPGDMQRLLGWGVDALITDRPDVAVPAVAAYARRPTC